MDKLLAELAHDHRELSGLLVAVHEALFRVERGASSLDDELHEIRDGVEAFREAVLEHFAHEQEGVLPFVVSLLPSTAPRIDALIGEHDRIAEALTKLERDLAVLPSSSTDTLTAFQSNLARFDELYAAHTREETAFFTDVGKAIEADGPAVSRLRALLEGRP